MYRLWSAAVEANCPDLKAGTKYSARAYARNRVGTAYGEEVSFTTENEAIVFGSFTDSRDGHTYKTVQIGEQTWMAENLAYLPSVSPSTSGSDSEFYYYVYGYEGNSVNDAKETTNYNTYGVLYNWEAAKFSCPSGWHLPSDAEWTILSDYLTNNGFGYGGSGDDIAKALASKTYWDASVNEGTPGNDSDTNNSSGFSAFPGGMRVDNGYFGYIGSYCIFWSSTNENISFPWKRTITDSPMFIKTNGMKETGLSVRCVKDN